MLHQSVLTSIIVAINTPQPDGVMWRSHVSYALWTGIWLQPQRLFMLQNKFLFKPMHSCQWNTMKTLTTYKHRLFVKITNVFMTSVYMFLFLPECVFLSHTVCQSKFASKAAKNRKKPKLKGSCKISLSIWHLGKHSPWEVSQDTLWHLKQWVEVSSFDTCSHKVQNIVMKCNTLYRLIKCPFISVIRHQTGAQQMKCPKLVLTTNVSFNRNPPWNIHATWSHAVYFTFMLELDIRVDLICFTMMVVWL